MKKRYCIGEGKEPLADKLGGCIVSDRITVDGAPIGWITRDASSRPEDSGWAFFAGDESQDYMDEPDNFSVWHVNDIANVDRAIVPLLYAAPGARYERDGTGFVEAPDSEPDPDAAKLPSHVRIVQGAHRLTEHWSLVLPVPYRRRVEDGSLVLWRLGVTFWINAFTGDSDLAKLRAAISPAATDLRIGDDRFSYRLHEGADDGRRPALYAFVVAATGHLQLGIYFDREADAAEAYAILASCAYR
jgi:hypothetical protein